MAEREWFGVQYRVPPELRQHVAESMKAAGLCPETESDDSAVCRWMISMVDQLIAQATWRVNGPGTALDPFGVMPVAVPEGYHDRIRGRQP
jgi:hypothetical protein